MGFRALAHGLFLLSAVHECGAFNLAVQWPTTGVVRRHGNLCSAVRMADGAPAKKRIVLGPGLFSPDIQVGPEKAKTEKAPEILVARPQVEALFKSLDSDNDGKLNKEELFDLVLSLGNKCVNTAAAAFTKLNSGSKTGLISMSTFCDWYAAGEMSKVVPELQEGQVELPRLSQLECQSMFQIVDKDGDNQMNVDELKSFEKLLGLEWPEGKCEDVFRRLNVDGSGQLSFTQFYAWYSSTDDVKGGPSLKEATALLLKPDSATDARKIFVRGFPTKAPESVVSRFFARCGAVEKVKLLSLEDGNPSGRLILTFEDEESVEGALEMHRFKIGKRGHLEVYRVNRGDKEEVKEVKKELHGALIGVRGANVQRMQKESKAKVFFEAYGKREVMIIKGTAQERETAWTMAQEIIEGNHCATHKVDASMHGRLIGSKGNIKIAMQEESGAHIVYRKEQEMCLIYGNEEARTRAWKLIKDKMWAMDNTSEKRYPLGKKFHGMLTGKSGVTVKALQEATGAQIRFVKSEGDEDKGFMTVRGTPDQCEKAWKYSQVLIRELPLLLSELREEDIALGSLRSLPLSASQVWKVAVNSAIETAEKEFLSPSPADGKSEASKQDVVML